MMKDRCGTTDQIPSSVLGFGKLLLRNDRPDKSRYIHGGEKRESQLNLVSRAVVEFYQRPTKYEKKLQGIMSRDKCESGV